MINEWGQALTEIDQKQTVSRIADKIVRLAEAHKGERRPYLVSALGIDLGEELRTLKLLTNQTLNEFIQSRLADRVTLVRLGTHRNVTAILSGSVDPSSIDSLQPAGEQQKRFHVRFWAAFSVPPEKDVRVLNLKDFTFEDVTQAEIPEGAVTIDHGLIAPIEAEDRDALIKANIAQWLETNDLSEEHFLARKRLPRPTCTPTIQSGGSLLEGMILALDLKQLQSTSLSLDVVAALLRTPRS